MSSETTADHGPLTLRQALRRAAQPNLRASPQDPLFPAQSEDNPPDSFQDLVLPSSAETLDSAAQMNRDDYSFEPPLTRVCHQMRAEARPMFYARTRFDITVQGRQTERLETWLRLVGEQCLRLVPMLNVTVQERDFLMLLAVLKVSNLVGGHGVRYGLERENVEYMTPQGRRPRGHGRHKNWERRFERRRKEMESKG